MEGTSYTGYATRLCAYVLGLWARSAGSPCTRPRLGCSTSQCYSCSSCSRFSWRRTYLEELKPLPNIRCSRRKKFGRSRTCFSTALLPMYYYLDHFLAWAELDRISLKRRTQRPIPSAPESKFNDAAVVVGGFLIYIGFIVWGHEALIGFPLY